MKIAFSGSHGTGKTTSVFMECYELKKLYKNVDILTETARESPLPINRDATSDSQLWIFCRQIEREISLGALNDAIVCDRTIVDICAYCFFTDRNLFKNLFYLSKSYINTYDWVYFKTVENNNYLIEDGIRDTDRKFQNDIETKMVELYREFGYKNITYV